MPKLKKVKGKSTVAGGPVPEKPYKPSFYFNSKQLPGLKDGNVGKSLNVMIQGKLTSIRISKDKEGEKTSYDMEIDKMSIPQAVSRDSKKTFTEMSRKLRK